MRIILTARVPLRVLVSLGHWAHVHVVRLVLIAAIVAVLIRVSIVLIVVVLLTASCLLSLIQSTVLLDVGVDALEALLLDIVLALTLAEASIAAHILHGVAVSLAILGLVDLSSWWGFLVLARRQDRLLHHDLVLVLLVLVLEVSPLGQDLHGLDVLDGSELLSVVLVSAQGVKIYLLAKTLVLVLHDLQDGVDLLAVQDLLVIHTRNRVEDSPHDFWVIHSAEMVTNVQAEDDLVQLGLFNSDALVAQWWWQLSEEIWQSNCSHVQLTHGVVLGPRVLESLDILLLKSQDVVLVLRLLVVVETLTDNGNEHIHENEE